MALASTGGLPCGLDDNKMPVGMQILGAPGNRRFVVEVATALEAVLANHPITQRPKPKLDRLLV